MKVHDKLNSIIEGYDACTRGFAGVDAAVAFILKDALLTEARHQASKQDDIWYSFAEAQGRERGRVLQ